MSLAGAALARGAISLRSRFRYEAFAALAGLLAITTGALVLAGWAGDIDAFKRVFPGMVAMNPVTAFAFVLAGGSLWRQRYPPPVDARPVPAVIAARLAAAAVAAVGALRLAGYLLGWDTGVDQWLFSNGLDGAPGERPSRMATNTALALLLLGLGLLLIDAQTARNRRPADWLAVPVLLVSLLAICGYAYRVPELYGLAAHIPMTFHTALVAGLLALGLLCARPRRGLMALATRDSLSGKEVRRLVPVMVVALFVFGWLRLEGERRGLYGMELGVVLDTVANIAIFGGLVWWSAGALHRSEQKRSRIEAARDEALALNRLIMDNSLDVICVIDGDGRFAEVSAASTPLWGYAPAELVGRRYADLVHPDDQALTAAIAATIIAGQPALGFHNRYLRKDGRAITVDWSATWSEADGLMFCVARDATRRMEAEQTMRTLNSELTANAAELQQSNREMEAFSYTISHDLRAPLRHIDGYARMLHEDAADRLDGDARRYLDEIGVAARHMGTLIDDLLAFSRLGRKPVERIEVDVNALLERVLEEAGAGTDGRVQVEPLPSVQADPVLLKQVWVNLVSNALKYSAPRGNDARIQITGERDGAVLRYRIRDNGVGFDMRYADKLFGVFQRLHSQEEFEGTGVGLAIVQRILSRHGGSIAAESQVGQGATFSFDLPGIDHEPDPVQDREMCHEA